MDQTSVNLRTDDGVLECHTFKPAGNGSWPAVIFYMDGLGVRPQLAEMARRLASLGYFVLLPNLYYRSGPFEPFDPVAVFAGGPERDRLMALFQATNSAAMMRDTAACLEFLSRQPDVLGREVGVTGYCMGGRCALTAAGTYPDRVVAAGCFHGGGLATDQPDSPHLLAKNMRARLYIAVAGIDQSFSDEERERLREALQEAGVRFTLEVYPDVIHGFAVPGLPVYNEAASERHWVELLRLFRETLPAGVAAATFA